MRSPRRTPVRQRAVVSSAAACVARGMCRLDRAERVGAAAASVRVFGCVCAPVLLHRSALRSAAAWLIECARADRSWVQLARASGGAASSLRPWRGRHPVRRRSKVRRPPAPAARCHTPPAAHVHPWARCRPATPPQLQLATRMLRCAGFDEFSHGPARHRHLLEKDVFGRAARQCSVQSCARCAHCDRFRPLSHPHLPLRWGGSFTVAVPVSLSGTAPPT